MSLPVHPAAALFPMLGEDELTALQNDIMVEGQLEPIITWKGQIIDGRNRYEACQRIGKKPRLKERDFDDEDAVINYIISTNIKRRHLTTSQRAMIAADLANLERGSNQHVHILRDGSRVKADTGEPVVITTPSKAAEAMGVHRDSVNRARNISKADPVLAQKVKAGEVTLNAAHKQIAPPKPKPDPVVVPDPDFAHMDDPPPLISPAKPTADKRIIPPDPDEDIDAWRETQNDPDANWYEPTTEARAALAAVMALDDESRQWVRDNLDDAQRAEHLNSATP